MFDQIKDMIKGQIERTDPNELAAAAEEHVGSIPHGDLVNQVQTAVANLQQTNPDLAQKLQGLVSQIASNPSDFKGAIVGFIQSNPQVLQQFSPDFAQGLLSKL